MRAVERRELHVAGHLRVNDTRFAVDLVNISVVGARLSSAVPLPLVGDVTLEIDALSIPATVRWSRGSDAGLMFLRPVPGPEIDRLCGPAGNAGQLRRGAPEHREERPHGQLG